MNPSLTLKIMFFSQSLSWQEDGGYFYVQAPAHHLNAEVLACGAIEEIMHPDTGGSYVLRRFKFAAEKPE